MALYSTYNCRAVRLSRGVISMRFSKRGGRASIECVESQHEMTCKPVNCHVQPYAAIYFPRSLALDKRGRSRASPMTFPPYKEVFKHGLDEHALARSPPTIHPARLMTKPVPKNPFPRILLRDQSHLPAQTLAHPLISPPCLATYTRKQRSCQHNPTNQSAQMHVGHAARRLE